MTSKRVCALAFATVLGWAASAGAWTNMLGEEVVFFPSTQFVRTGDLALLPSGDAIVAGSTSPPMEFTSPFAVGRFDAATGDLVWDYFIGHEEPSGLGVESWARSVDVDAAGDVLASGTVAAPDGQDVFAVKLDGDTGATLWTYQLAGVAAMSYDEGADGAVDAAGDFVVIGRVQRTESVQDVVVVKLDGQTGQQLWRHDLTEDPDLSSFPFAVEIDGSGNVVVVGQTQEAPSPAYDWLTVVAKLDGTNGTELWRQTLPPLSGTWGVRGAALALDSQGNALVTTQIGTTATLDDRVLAKLDAGTGAVLWRRDLDGPASGPDRFFDVAVDAVDDVVAVGSIDTGDTEFNLMKFRGVDGNDLWSREIPGSGVFDPWATGHALSLLPSGDVVASAIIRVSDELTWTVLRFSGATGAETCRAVLEVGLMDGFSLPVNNRVLGDAAGDIVATGVKGDDPQPASLAVVKRRGIHCGDFVPQTVPATPLVARVVLALALAGFAWRRLR